MVKVKLFANFREIIGKREIEINADSVVEVKEKLAKISPEIEKLYNYAIIMVNGKVIEDEQHKVSENDVIAIFPPVSGGILFKELISLNDAQKLFLQNISPFTQKDVEEVYIENALSRVLAEDVYARIDVPHYNRAAMDGYAVKHISVIHASRDRPVILKISNNVTDETCVYVHTGDAIPNNADAVVKREDVEENNGFIEIYKAVRKFENVGLAGEDIKKGEMIAKKGEILNQFHLALLRSSKVEKVRVFRRPRILIIPTGDELLKPSDELIPGKVYESNSIMISGLIKKWGGDVETYDIVPDNKEIIERVFEDVSSCESYDLIIPIGGTSVGRRDYVYQILSKIGDVLFRGVALTPGKPTITALVNEKLFLCLPGFPSACVASAYLFLKPAIKKMLNLGFEDGFTVKLGEKIYSKLGYTSFVRLNVNLRERVAYPIATSGSGIISSLVKSNSYTLVGEDIEVVESGEEIEVYFL